MNNVEINKQAKLSEHFSLGELTKTKHVTADKNIPSHEVIENLKRLCWWLEELRYSYNTLYCLQPGEDYETSENVEGIVVNSGYRSPAVNKLAGGVPTSNHVTGCAVDIRVSGKEQMIRYASILLDIADSTGKDYDELLLEQHGNICWVHFAVRPPGQQNRRRISFESATNQLLASLIASQTKKDGSFNVTKEPSLCDVMTNFRFNQFFFRLGYNYMSNFM